MTHPTTHSRWTAALALVLVATAPVSSLAAEAEGAPFDARQFGTHDALVRVRKEMGVKKHVFTPEGLAKALFTDNTDVALQLEGVTRARDKVGLARSSLLPSINLGLSMTLTNPPLFLVSSVSCLVPFLFPSNWYELKEAKAGYQAEIYALHATRLNTFATGFALLARIFGDMKTYQLVVDREIALREYVSALRVRREIGLVSQMDVDLAEGELGNLTIALSKMRELLTAERAVLREMVAAGYDVDISVHMSHAVAASKLEELPLQEGLDQIYMRSSERTQLDHLVRAAEANVGSARWSFLGGCSGSQGSFSTGGGATSGFTTGAGVNFGFGYFPSVRIAKSEVRTLKLRQQKLYHELKRVLETTYYAAQEAQIQIDATADLESKAQSRYEQALAQKEGGVTGVRDILDAFSAVTLARSERISAESALTGHRITLQRLMLEGLFYQILLDSKKAYEK